MTQFSPQLIAWLLAYKYFLLIPLVAIEGPFITVFAGFLASMGQIDFTTAYGVIMLGDLIGDTSYYSLARWGGRRWVKRWGRYIGMSDQRMVKLEGQFKRHPAKILVFGKMAHGLGGTILLAAGLAKIPLYDFLMINLLATIPKSLILLSLGFYFGSAYYKVNNYLDDMAIIVTSLSLAYIVLYIIIPIIVKKLTRVKV